jgi:hypothetical protein
MKDFVAAYRSHYGLTPTQRSFFVYNAVGGGRNPPSAIRRAGRYPTGDQDNNDALAARWQLCTR